MTRRSGKLIARLGVITTPSPSWYCLDLAVRSRSPVASLAISASNLSVSTMVSVTWIKGFGFRVEV